MTPDETVSAFIKAVIANDLGAAAALAADDIVYDNVPMPTINGVTAMREFLAGMEESDWIVHRQIAVGDVVMNERTDRIKFGGTWIELPVAGVFEVHNGRITLWRDYFDMQTFTSQMAGN